MTIELADTPAATSIPVRRIRRNLYDVVFSPLTAAFAVAALVLSFVLPPDGIGVTICWFQSLYGLPCPGCGLTRSLTCISHLQFSKAWNYHPFGPLIYALFVANAVLLFLPRTTRRALRRQASQSDGWLKPIYVAIVLSFVAFGGMRILSVVLSS